MKEDKFFSGLKLKSWRWQQSTQPKLEQRKQTKTSEKIGPRSISEGYFTIEVIIAFKDIINVTLSDSQYKQNKGTAENP